MSEHPIQGLMRTAMDSIQDMVDVNTIIGEPIEASDNVMIIPISRVCFSFAAGGSEFNSETLDEYKKKEKEEEMQYKLPFGGGSGAGVSIKPVAFLVINNENIRLMPMEYVSTVDKALDYIPELVEKFIKKVKEDDEDETTEKVVKRKINIKPEKKEIKENKFEKQIEIPYEQWKAEDIAEIFGNELEDRNHHWLVDMPQKLLNSLNKTNLPTREFHATIMRLFMEEMSAEW